ncbi:hypothetical protein M758_2G189400 [Ceratodon purpureus]|nr:hypothetical protein M758_2G189400 [Ceratodon purpureus]
MQTDFPSLKDFQLCNVIFFLFSVRIGEIVHQHLPSERLTTTSPAKYLYRMRKQHAHAMAKMLEH